MGAPVRSKEKRVATTSINQLINKEVFDEFKAYCRKTGYPMNTLVETFMQQYANGRFVLTPEEVDKWRHDDSESDTLNTTFNKEIYQEFKAAVKSEGCFVRQVLTAFMERFVSRNYILEFVEVKKRKY